MDSIYQAFTNLGQLLIANYADCKATAELVFMIPMVFGELGLGLWLLFKGGKLSTQNKVKP